MTTGPLQHRPMYPTNKNFADLVYWVDNGTLTLDPPYQRGDVWTTTQRVMLIKSLLLGIPVAALVLNERGAQNRWWDGQKLIGGSYYACIDGKQRITTLHMWMHDKLPVPAEWFDPLYLTRRPADHPVVHRRDLTEDGQRVLGNLFHIPVVNARLGTVEEEAEVFDLINFAGTPHVDPRLIETHRRLADAQQERRVREAAARTRRNRHN